MTIVTNILRRACQAMFESVQLELRGHIYTYNWRAESAAGAFKT